MKCINTNKKQVEPIQIAINCYIVFILLGILLWIPFPSITHFFGASSLVYAFLFAISPESPYIIKCISFFWIVCYVAGTIVGVVIAKKKKRFVPVLVLGAVELVVSSFFLFLKVTMGNNTELFPGMLGLLARALYFLSMICIYDKYSREQLM